MIGVRTYVMLLLLLLLLLLLCYCSVVFQSDSPTLESVNGSLKVVYFTPNTSGVSVCVLCVVCESGEEGG